METALISLVCIAMVIIGTVTLCMSAFQGAISVTDSVKAMETEAGIIRRTGIAAVPPAQYSGGNIELMVRNEGQTNLSQFSRWDVIAQYLDDSAVKHVDYVEYTAGNPPGPNQWTVEGIYLLSGDPEAFDPNILDPWEQMKIVINLDPGIGTYGRITVSTPNGVTSECPVSRN
uniref:Flagellin n=1 Tax=viral metagenome TaxID=1070528 RepID=A0A6H1Z7G8_9ZZZZ